MRVPKESFEVSTLPSLFQANETSAKLYRGIQLRSRPDPRFEIKQGGGGGGGQKPGGGGGGGGGGQTGGGGGGGGNQGQQPESKKIDSKKDKGKGKQ